jgi:hypothetical protein
MAGLQVRPLPISRAKEVVGALHRHHRPPVGALFAIAAEVGGELVGCVMVGRPVARGLQDGFTAEVTRLATNGYPNACSFLYAAAWRAARALGYRRMVTYILAEEPGTSLKAMKEGGWREVAGVRGRSWSCDSRPREDGHPLGDKVRWEVAVS